MILKFKQSLELTQICFRAPLKLQTENKCTGCKASNKLQYTFLMDLDNVSPSLGVIHSGLEVKVIRHLKRKIVKFEHNLIIKTRWLQFEPKKRAVMNEFILRVIVVLLLGYGGGGKVSKSGDFHYWHTDLK
jgi:hypothetical protein